MPHPVADVVRAFAHDASQTIARIKADARHLAELGERAKIGAELAARSAAATLERAAERALDELGAAFEAIKR